MKKILLAVICVETFLISLSLLLYRASKNLWEISILQRSVLVNTPNIILWYQLSQQLYTVALGLACVTIGFLVSSLIVNKTTIFKP